MICECGHGHASNVPTSYRCRCGRNVTVTPELLPLSSRVRTANSELFRLAASCRRDDVLAMLDRRGDVGSLETLDQLARHLKKGHRWKPSRVKTELARSLKIVLATDKDAR